MHASKLPVDVVVIDTCVLISNVLRFLSLGLAKAGYFQPAWSPKIRDEWLRNASRLWSVDSVLLEKDWVEWDTTFPLADQGVVHSWQEGLQYSDPKDWHVIAAARAAQTRFTGRSVSILTRNIKDFNRGELRRLGIERWSPDAFFCALLPFASLDILRLLEALPLAVKAPDKPELSVVELLKRERLFVLNQFYQQQVIT